MSDSKKKRKGKADRPTVSPHFTLNDDFKPFSEWDSVFGRIKWDKKMKTYKIFMYDKVPQILDENQIGYTQIDHALAIASWTTHDYFRLAFSWEKLGNPNNMMPGISPEKYEINKDMV